MRCWWIHGPSSKPSSPGRTERCCPLATVLHLGDWLAQAGLRGGEEGNWDLGPFQAGSGWAGRSVIPLGVRHPAPCLPRQVASDNADFYTNTYVAFYRDLGANRALLGSAINWGQAFCILGNMGPTALGRATQRLSR